MFLLFCYLGFGHILKSSYTTTFPPSPIGSFGFEVNGTFSVQVSMNKNSKSLIYLSTESINNGNFRDMCQISEKKQDLFFEYLESGNKEIVFRGNILKKGIYYLYIATCVRNVTVYTFNISFLNPDSRIDTRNEKLPSVFLFFSSVYACLFMVWVAYMNFYKIHWSPIQIAFMVQPLIKAVSANFNARFWIIHRDHDPMPRILSYTYNFLDVLYYSTFLSSYSFVCKGCNIFRKKFKFHEHVSVILASALMTSGIIGIPYVNSEVSLIITLAITAIGWIWYLKIDVVSLIIMSKILDRIRYKKSLHLGIQNARDFLIHSYSIAFVTFVTYISLFLSTTPASTCDIVIEIGFLVCSILQARFFLQRNPNPMDDIEKSNSILPVFLREPASRSLVVLDNN